MPRTRLTASNCNGSDAQSGFALVAVLGLALVISAVLVPLSLSARLRALTAENALRSYRYTRLTEILTRHVAENIAASSRRGETDVSRASGASPCVFGEYSIELGMQDHAGLIDLNAAGIALLEIGFLAIGLPEEKASALALATDNYRRLDRKYEVSSDVELVGTAGYKHAAFEDVIELQDFVSLQSISPVAIANTFTVQTRSGTLLASAAPTHISRILASRPSGSMPFVTSTASPRAMTVYVKLFRHKKLESTSNFVFGLSGTRVSNLGAAPAHLLDSDVASYFGRDLACDDIVSEPVRAAVGSVLQ